MSLINGSGRIGRLNFLAINLVVTLAAGFVLYFTTSVHPITGEAELNPGVLIGVGALAAWLNTCNSIRRLHDCGHSGWLILISLIPIISLGLSLYLLFKRGDQGRNSFGWPPGMTEVVDRQTHRARMEQIMATSGQAYSSGGGARQAPNQTFTGGWDS